MNDNVRQFLIGAGSIFLVPAGIWPKPQFTITIPNGTVMQALAGDFARVSSDLTRAAEAVEHANQMEFSDLILDPSAQSA